MLFLFIILISPFQIKFDCLWRNLYSLFCEIDLSATILSKPPGTASKNKIHINIGGGNSRIVKKTVTTAIKNNESFSIK